MTTDTGMDLMFDHDYYMRQAYRNKLQEMYYNAVILNEQDMLVDSNDNVVLFGTKIVVRRYAWNEKTQTFDKVPTGAARAARRSKRISADHIKGEISNHEEEEEEFA